MKRHIERALVVALCAAVGWFYVWTVRSSGDPWKFGLEQRDYYNLLIDGWLEGQLHMKVEVPEALLRIKEPYDPVVRGPVLGLHDASFYKGKYYLYFGVAPVVVLMLPFRLWAGFDLPLAVAVLVFVYGAFLTSVVIWGEARRRYFPNLGAGPVGLGVVVLGLAGLGPVLLRRPHMWELPIGAGGCFAMLALLCIWHSVHAPRREGPWRLLRKRTGWFAAAGLFLGLAIASRPTYLIASPFLLVPLVVWWRAEGRPPWRPVLGALIPLAIIGSAMAWHNHARFEHPLQFGQAYQFSLDHESKMAHFRVSHAPFNGWRYFLSAAEWSARYPFIQPAALPPKPPGFGGHDDVYGLLTNLPVAWLALVAPLALWRRDQTGHRALGAWLAAAAVLFAGMAGTLLIFFGSLARYQSDFAPVLMLLAVMGLAALQRWLHVIGATGWRLAAGIAGGALALASAGFAILYSLQLDGLLLERNPPKHLEVARAFNRVPAAWQAIMGETHGPLELILQPTPAAPGTRQELIAVGDGRGVDRVEAVWLEGDQVRFEVASAHGAQYPTRPARILSGTTQRLRIILGSLLPHETHPAYGKASAAQTAAVTQRLRLEFNGEVLADESPWFSVPPGKLRVAAQEAAGSGGPFRVLSWRRDGQAMPALLTEGEARAATALGRLEWSGTLRLRARFPRARAGTREPLVVTGRPGRGDLVAVEYVDSGSVRFVFDHWGAPLVRSEPIPVDFSRQVELRITMESLRAPSEFRRVRGVTGGELQVRLGDRAVWRVPAEFFVVNPVEVAIGRNPIGGTTCGAFFSGTIHQVGAAGR
jgi:hypothetical protein